MKLVNQLKNLLATLKYNSFWLRTNSIHNTHKSNTPILVKRFLSLGLICNNSWKIVDIATILQTLALVDFFCFFIKKISLVEKFVCKNGLMALLSIIYQVGALSYCNFCNCLIRFLYQIQYFFWTYYNLVIVPCAYLSESIDFY